MKPNININKEKQERCSTKPFCEHLTKINGTYHCDITREEVDNGDEEDGSDYIFLRTKDCLNNFNLEKMTNKTKEEYLKWFEDENTVNPYNEGLGFFDFGEIAYIASRKVSEAIIQQQKEEIEKLKHELEIAEAVLSVQVTDSAMKYFDDKKQRGF